MLKRYIDMGEALRDSLQALDGFISIERFRSVTDPNKVLALSFWRDEAAVEACRKNGLHRTIQATSRRELFRDYRLRVPRYPLMDDERQAIAWLFHWPPNTKSNDF
jgi:heme-degrading monooxygenase HmoA